MAAKKGSKPRKARTPVDPNENKSQRFIRLAQARVPKALKAIANIGNLSGNGYESTGEQREKIIATLKNAVNVVAERLTQTVNAAPTEFKL